MADSVNMSLDEIIKHNKQHRASRSRGRGGRGGGPVRGRGGNRGVARGRGRGGRGRGRSQSRPDTPQRQGRSQSRGPRGRSQSQSRVRSRSRQQRRSSSRARSRSRSQLRGLTPKGRAGLEDPQYEMPSLIRTRSLSRGVQGYRGRRGNMANATSVHNRLGISTKRGGPNLRRPLAVAKRGISKRGRGLSTANRYSNVGLRSDQIIKEQHRNLLHQNNMIRSQTFTRSRNNSFTSASHLTVRVANDLAKRRRNSLGNAGYLNKQSLAQLNNQFGGYNTRRGAGSVKSMGSNRSNQSNASRRSARSRGRGRGGRGGRGGINMKFVNKQVLNIKLQKEIAAIQGKTFGHSTLSENHNGVNFTPTPAATEQTLHQRFASST